MIQQEKVIAGVKFMIPCNKRLVLAPDLVPGHKLVLDPFLYVAQWVFLFYL